MTRTPAARTFLLASICLPAAASAQVLCGPWSIVPTPNPGNSTNRLTSISARATGEVWAVGHWKNTPSGAGMLALRWDGSAWAQEVLPSTAGLGTMPDSAGIEITPGGDVWIVGNVTTTYPTYNMPLVMRRRGGVWDIVGTFALRPQTVYPYAARGGMLYDIAAVSDNDIWAVGLAAGYGDGGATSVPFAAHWDGSSWTDVEVPRVANRHHELEAVVAISSNDVWAVGDYRNVAGAYRGVTYHWDGSQWSHIASPIESMPGSGLFAVGASAGDNVWAVGTVDGTVVVMRWDGSQWNLMPAPANSGGSIAVRGVNDVLMTGWNGFWHWNGAAWAHTPVQVPGASYVIRSGGLEIAGNCEIWSAGFWQSAAGITYTLTERPSALCYANCDQSTQAPVLNVADFACFLQKFAAGEPYANCDGSTQAPTLNVADFSCFLQKFAVGCG